METFYIYGALDIKTNKLVSDITSPNRKFWVHKSTCQNAISNYRWKRYDLKLVKIKCEVVDEEE